jgi:hypothetical protein
VVLEPVAGNNGERDQERDELRADRVAERGKAPKGRYSIINVERRHQQRQREGEGRIDEANRTVKFGLIPRVPHSSSSRDRHASSRGRYARAASG